jgi:hypothetical protein
MAPKTLRQPTAEEIRKAAKADKKKKAAKRDKRWEPQFPGSHRGF